jgi:peptidoglycan hydrolase-like protein with peptidoglycan-binding domain
MRRLLSCAMVVVLAIGGITWFTLASAAPAHAQASCTGASLYKNTANELAEVPTIGNNTHNDDCDLGVGNNSNAVYWLQFDLNQCYGRHLAEDGDYGSLTKAAVEYAQGKSGATVDGIYGPQTRDHIKWVNYGGAGPSACFKL